MIGAIIGDTAGSRFEFANIHTMKFTLLTPECSLTDDSIMSIAVAEAVMEWEDDGYREKKNYEKLKEYAVSQMRRWGRKYPDAGYGGHFAMWLESDDMGPYNSCGNGSAMRISPVGWASESLEECIAMSRAVTEVTHNHPDGIMGAEATAVQIFLSRKGMSLDELKKYEEEHYYPLDNYSWDYLKDHYKWHSLCDGTCQAAFTALYESKSYEDAVRSSISLGGDSDTIAAICGAIAEAVYPIDRKLREKIASYMSEEEKDVVRKFQSRYVSIKHS